MIGLGNSVVKRKLGGGPPAAPVNVSQPFLVGTGEVGTVVTCNRGSWSGSPTPTYTYDFRLDSVSVQNGSSNSYTPLLADDGKTLTCLVTATNSQGSASEGTSNSIVIGIAPSNTIAPTLSPSGTQSTGTVITANVGTWTGTPTITYEYRWTRNGSPISLATNSTYTIQAADDGTTIRCEVRGTNAYGVSSFVASSNSVSAVNAVAPVNTVAPVISGSTTLGSTLTSTTGTWTGTPTPTYSYQWKRNGSNIGGATASTYVTTLADSSANITCDVTATNTAGSATAGSNTIALPSYAPVNTAAPVVSGTAVVGQTLSTTNGTWTNSPSTYSYQWYRGATLISGATNSTYTLVQADAGNTSNIKCVVTATNIVGSASADSNTIATIFDATAWSYIQAANITDSTQRQAANFEMYTMKAGGVTSGYLGLYPLIGGTADTHKWNMFNAVDSDAAKRLVFSGTITHSSNGMQGNGTNGVANTFINPSTDTTNDLTIWYYTRSTTNNSGATDLGVVAGVTNPGVFVGVRQSQNVVTSVNANIDVFSRTTGSIEGFWLVKRVGNTITIKYNNSVVRTYTAANLSLQNGSVRLLAYLLLPSTITSYSNKQYTDFGFLNIGTSDAQDTAIFNAVVGKETILGRNV